MRDRCENKQIDIISVFLMFRFTFLSLPRSSDHCLILISKFLKYFLTVTVMTTIPATLLIIVVLSFTTLKVCATNVPSIQCGTTEFTQGLITKGTKTTRGEWPFLTALLTAETKTFFCGGTLISTKHVLTGRVDVLFFPC